MSITFLLNFQEPLGPLNNDLTGTETETFTKTLEERDQDTSHFFSVNLTGTETFTESSEEPDQDKSNYRYSLFGQNKSLLIGTETFTRSFEEKDQDESNRLMMATKTATSSLEERDQYSDQKRFSVF